MNIFNFLNKPKYKKPAKPETRKTLGNVLNREVASRERLDFNAILGILPDPDEILSTANKDLPVYRKVMIDSQVRACANSRKAGTMSLNWEIDRGKAKSRQAKMVHDMYDDMDIDALNSAILNAPFFGFQPIEIMWGKVGNFILPVDLVPKNPEWFNFGTKGELKILTLGNALMGEDVPDRKFLTPTYNDIHNKYYNPYGDRVLSSCFWAATFKKSGFKWWVTFTEKYGMPYIVGKLPRSVMDSDRENMKNQLEAMVMDAVAVISDDAQLEFLSGGEKGVSADLYDKLIVACDESISKAILGQTLTTDGSQKGSGSYALGKVHAGVREDIVYSDKKIVERTHNQLIRWIWEVNFNTGDVPKFSMYEEEDVDKLLAERDEILVKQGVKFTKQYYSKNYNLDDTDFEVSEPVETKSPMESGQPEFAENKENDLDAILAQFDDTQLQNQINSVIKPVLKKIRNSEDYAEVKKHLDKLTPEMNSREIDNTLAQILVLTQSFGRFDVKKKD